MYYWGCFQMKTLNDYLTLVEKEYNYRIKVAKELTEKQFDRMERILQKYDLLEVKSIHKTPIQKSPLDFATLDNVEVYIIDIVTRLPMSPTIFRNTMAETLRMHPNYIIVRGDNDPLDRYNQEIVDMQEQDYVVKMLDIDYKSDGVDAADIHSPEYRENLVKDIETVTMEENNNLKLFKKALEKSSMKIRD